MMKNTFKFFYLLLLIGLNACTDDDNLPKGDYETGIFIVNEGAFGQGNGSLTYYQSEDETLVPDAFREVNGYFAGDVFQHLHIDGDKAYLVLNGSGIVRVVNAHTLDELDVWDDESQLFNPRRLATSGSHVLVTNWGDFDENFNLPDSWVAVFDKNTGNFIKKIAVPNGSEHILVSGNKAYVACSEFGNNNKVAVINLSSLEVENTLELPNGPLYMQEDKNADIWVLCRAGWGSDEGRLVKIDGASSNISGSLTITPKPGSYIALDAAKEHIYYHIGQNVYKVGINATEAPSNPYLQSSVSISGLNADPRTDQLYISHTPDFTSVGKVLVYDSNKQLINEIEAGIAPHMVLIK